MEPFQSFIKSLQSQGANIIIITDTPEQFSEIEEAYIVDDWFKSWEIVDRLAGEKRRMLDLNEWHENPSEFDAFEMYVGGGIMDRGLLWFDYEVRTPKDRINVQMYLKDIKHMVVLLGGADLFLSIADIQKKWENTLIKDFVVGPHFSFPDVDNENYFCFAGLTVILEWPRKNLDLLH
jgi:hypothetical protein